MEQNDSNYSNDYSYEEESKVTMFDAWVTALTSPNTEAYNKLGKATNASLANGALWVLLAAIIGGVVSALLSAIFGASQLALLSNVLGETGMDIPARTGSAAILSGIFCGAPVGAIIGTLGFLLSSVIENWLANLFGGKGTLDSYTFVNASFTAPITLVSTMLSPIPFIGGLFLFLLGIYSLFLSFINLRGVKQLSTGKAILVILIPMIVAFILVGCLVLVFGAVIASAFSNFAS